ncbi:MAG: multiple antibiotic resistance (MarC)-like protein [Ectothiorhodospiraceae bacterium]|nr:multiple antibiotic resistance (MarC)-like protein [Ectothiorhodospiraceae bacterium]
MLNPFALFIYLTPIMEELNHRTFMKVLIKATLISTVIFYSFLLIGNVIFEKVFLIQFESFRIFGGIVIFSYAFTFIVRGQKALLYIKEDLDDLASEIALPFMVGAGSISLTILMRFNYELGTAAILLGISMVLCFTIIIVLKFVKDKVIRERFKPAFDKNIAIILRLNSFFVGAIGIDMVITGINRLYF